MRRPRALVLHPSRYAAPAVCPCFAASPLPAALHCACAGRVRLRRRPSVTSGCTAGSSGGWVAHRRRTPAGASCGVRPVASPGQVPRGRCTEGGAQPACLRSWPSSAGAAPVPALCNLLFARPDARCTMLFPRKPAPAQDLKAVRGGARWPTLLACRAASRSGSSAARCGGALSARRRTRPATAARRLEPPRCPGPPAAALQGGAGGLRCRPAAACPGAVWLRD